MLPTDTTNEQRIELIRGCQGILRWGDRELAEEWGYNRESVGRWKRDEHPTPPSLVDALAGLMVRRGQAALWFVLFENVTGSPYVPR